MSKQKPALPERLYYRLADAAEWLSHQGAKCSADNLLHYGACGYVELIATTSALYSHQRIFRADQAEPYSWRIADCSGFISLRRSDIEKIERNGFSVVLQTEKIYSIDVDGVAMYDVVGEYRAGLVEFCLSENIDPVRYSMDMSTWISEAQDDLVPPTLSASHLWVLTEELQRFLKEGASHVRIDPPDPEQIVRSGKSNKLAYLNQASAMFWANADPNDRITHSDNNVVAAWLEGKGFSASLAQKAASIIRPEWASVGRKPEE